MNLLRDKAIGNFAYVSPGSVMQKTLTDKVMKGQIRPDEAAKKIKKHGREVRIGDLQYAKDRLTAEDRTIPKIVDKRQEFTHLANNEKLPHGEVRKIKDSNLHYVMDADSWHGDKSKMGYGWNRYAGMSEKHIQDKVLPNLDRTMSDIRRKHNI